MRAIDFNQDTDIGYLDFAHSVWLLNKYGSTWHYGKFYQDHYQKVVSNPDEFNIYATRVFARMLYWLGIVHKRYNNCADFPLQKEFRKTNLLDVLFSFKKS